MVVCFIKKAPDAWSTSNIFFLSAFLPVTVILPEKIISWKGSSDACFV